MKRGRALADVRMASFQTVIFIVLVVKERSALNIFEFARQMLGAGLRERATPADARHATPSTRCGP